MCVKWNVVATEPKCLPEVWTVHRWSTANSLTSDCRFHCIAEFTQLAGSCSSYWGLCEGSQASDRASLHCHHFSQDLPLERFHKMAVNWVAFFWHLDQAKDNLLFTNMFLQELEQKKSAFCFQTINKTSILILHNPLSPNRLPFTFVWGKTHFTAKKKLNILSKAAQVITSELEPFDSTQSASTVQSPSVRTSSAIVKKKYSNLEKFLEMCYFFHFSP